MKATDILYQNKPMKSAQGDYPKTEEYIRFANIDGVDVCFMNNRYLWPHNYNLRSQNYEYYIYVNPETEQWYSRYPVPGYNWEDTPGYQHLEIPYFDHIGSDKIFQFELVYDLPVEFITKLQTNHDWTVYPK